MRRALPVLVLLLASSAAASDSAMDGMLDQIINAINSVKTTFVPAITGLFGVFVTVAIAWGIVGLVKK